MTFPDENAKQAADTSSVARRARWTGALFCLILLLGGGLRLVHITTESVWWDEFATVVYLNPPREYEESPHFARWNEMVIRAPSHTLRDFLKQNQQLDPAAMPLYLTLEYYWNKFIHPSPTTLRLLSVMIGMAILPLVYLAARRLFNPTAGLIAMWCVALSPIHVQFAKEIRMYGLMTLLAILSVYAFIRLFNENRYRWWALYALAALLLSWTHPFALLLPLTQGLFWLFLHPRDIRRIIVWGLVNGLMLMPAAMYVLSIEFWEMDSTSQWMRLPTLIELVNDIFADDAIGATYQVNATPTAWRFFVGETAARHIMSWRWVAGNALIAGVLAAMAWLLARAWSTGRRMPLTERQPDDASPTSGVHNQSHRFAWSVFLVMWLVLPPLILYAISAVWRPCIMPRYTVHCSLALYMIVGGAVALMPRRSWRVAGVVAVCLFYGYQQMLMVGEPQHPDWLGATRHIRETAKSDDLLLAHNWLWRRVFAFNLGPVPNVVSYGSSFDILAEMSAFFLSLELPSIASDEEPRAVWVTVRTDYFVQGPIIPLERELDARGLQYESREFGGIQHVLVYRVWRDQRTPSYTPAHSFEGDAPREFSDLALEFWRANEYETTIQVAENAIRIGPDFSRAWSYKGMAHKELGNKEAALEALTRAVELDLYDYPWSHVNIAMLLIDLERYEEGVNASLRALEILPGDPWAYAMLGCAYLGLGEHDAAVEALRSAVAGNPGDMRIRQLFEQAENARDKQDKHE